MDNKSKIDLKDGYTVNEDGAVLYKDEVVLSQHQAEAIMRLIRYKAHKSSVEASKQIQDQIADTLRDLFGTELGTDLSIY